MTFLLENVNYEHMTLLTSVLSCFFMGMFYVLSLYLWKDENRYNRNQPSVIKRRFVSVLLSSLASMVFLYMLGERQTQPSVSNATINNITTGQFYALNEWIGFKFDLINVLKSSVVSLLLTVTIFSGPLVQQVLGAYFLKLKIHSYYVQTSSQNTSTTDNNNNNLRMANGSGSFTFLQFVLNSARKFANELLNKCKSPLNDLWFLRNYVISPFTEEFVFRSCMLPLLVTHMSLGKTISITPLFFGMAHLHHIIEGLKTNSGTFKTLLVQHLFQFSYTYIFGVYSSYLFLRTGCFFSSFLSHSFCNLMGFPHLDELVNDFNGFYRWLLIAIYMAGFALFFFLLPSLTNPIFFDNYLYAKYIQ